jgi:hypothetical protein
MFYEAESVQVPKLQQCYDRLLQSTRSVGHFSESLNEKGSSTDGRRQIAGK